MSVLDSLRKGLKFFLMSFGVSSPVKKPSAAKARPRQDSPPGEIVATPGADKNTLELICGIRSNELSDQGFSRR